jgi:CheY-like chemotaxis protein
MKRILVVDDDQSIIDLLKDALPTLGFDADFTTDGSQAIEMLKEQFYDLVLSDIRMPEINGIEVATAAIKNAPYVPVLFMSGNPNVEVEERSFLSKPFTITQLETKLSIMLEASSEA